MRKPAAALSAEKSVKPAETMEPSDSGVCLPTPSCFDVNSVTKSSLPDFVRVVEKRRLTGATAGVTDTYYVIDDAESATSKSFRSLPALRKHLQSQNACRQ